MKKYQFYLPNHNAFEITPVMENAVRIRYNATGIFKESLMERYELIKTSFDPIESRYHTDGHEHIFQAGELTVKIQESGEFTVLANGKMLFEKAVPILPQDDNGTGAVITIRDNERFYGGGYRPNLDIELRGQVIKNWCSPVINNGPSTWVMSSENWGIFWNHTGETYFDFGQKKTDELVLWSEKGELDVYIFSGTFKKMIQSFTDLTGKPCIMPLFGYGITTVASEAETEITLIDKAERLRKEKIPCDVFSLACEWMTKYYDYSVNQEFDQERYFIAPWMKEEHTFLYALKRFGIKTTLWTPCDYDLTFEQERRYFAKHPEAKKEQLYTRSIRRQDNSEMSIDANSRQFRDERLFGVRRHDKNTVPEEAWAEHFKKYFDLGVVGIAEDASAVALAKVDHCYANGYTYKEMHNLNQSLNAYQYYHIYREHTGKRIFVRTPSTFIGHQKYCGTWCGDTTSDTSLVGLVQYSFQGQSNVTADLISYSKEQIHSGMLMPWVLNFCWAHMSWPWMLSEELEKCYKFYARLRYALMPYVYTAAHRAHVTGIPICTAMVIHYPDDENFFNDYNQYMFGESFLVGALCNSVYLPEGKWIDYWTGKEYEGRSRITEPYPEDRGGYLFVKKGAIIPYWEDVDHVGQKPIDAMTIEIYPDREGSYALYEDDGESFEYENGAFSITNIHYSLSDDRLKVWIDLPCGSYEGMPKNRTYHVRVHMAAPSRLPEGARFDSQKGDLCFSLKVGEAFEVNTRG